MFNKALMLVVILMTLVGFIGCHSPENEHRGMADIPWPMFRHDAQHTGRSPYTGPESPALKWSYTTGCVVRSSPAIGEDGTIYVGSDDKYLYAINPDGTLKWNYETDDAVISSPAIGSDGTIYFGSGDDHLYAISPDGHLIWSLQTGSVVDSSPAIGPDGTIYVGSGDHLCAVNLDGKIKWLYGVERGVSSPAIGEDGTIYFTSGTDRQHLHDHSLYALNPDGGFMWRYETDDWASPSSDSPTLSPRLFRPSPPAIGQDGTIYASLGDNHYLYAVTAEGALEWRYETAVSGSVAIGMDGAIYLSSGGIHALNPDGSVRWFSRIPGGCSPTIGADGIIYVCSADSLYAVYPDGTLKWEIEKGLGLASLPAIAADGTIYVGSMDCHLYAIGEAGKTRLQ